MSKKKDKKKLIADLTDGKKVTNSKPKTAKISDSAVKRTSKPKDVSVEMPLSELQKTNMSHQSIKNK